MMAPRKRRDTGETSVFVDRVYFEGERDDETERELLAQARDLADRIGAPLYMAQDEQPDAARLEELKCVDPKTPVPSISVSCLATLHQLITRTFLCIAAFSGRRRVEGCTPSLLSSSSRWGASRPTSGGTAVMALGCSREGRV